MEGVLFALDIGTTKVCALVGEVRGGQLRITGLGIEPARGMSKGMIADVGEAAVAIATAVEKAEQTSGYDLQRAFVSMAGEHIGSMNTQGSIALKSNGTGVGADDVEKALDQAQMMTLRPGREIVHLVPRHFRIDDRVVRNPMGMHGHRLDVDAHVVTGTTMALMNLAKCSEHVGIQTEEFVLNSLASAEAVLEPNEREMDVVVVDIGGGTTDVALYAQGAVYHTAVIPIGGYHITNDIAIGLRVPYDMAENVKLNYGDCRPDMIDPNNIFTVQPFGGESIRVGRQDLAHVIEARLEEVFQLILRELEACGYQGLLPAGIVLTGGSSQLRGITRVAQKVLGVPARVAGPKNLVGLVDALRSPAYATSVGLLHWSISESNLYKPRPRHQSQWGNRIGNFFRAFLPG